jgi:ketosteroid isomerase-like protein
VSKENVEISRRSVAAFNAGDLDGALAAAREDVEWHVYLSPEGEVARGIDGIKRMWDERRDTFEAFEWHVDEFIDAGEAVIAVGELRGLAPGDEQTALTAPIVQVYWIDEDSRLWRVKPFRSLDEARAAVARGE